MEDKEFSHEESIRLINTMISKAKKSYVTKGIGPMVWGALIVFCSLFTWAQIQFHLLPDVDIWFLLILALLPQIYFTIKEKRQRKFKAYEEVVTGYVWTAFAISIFLTSFYNSKYGTNESSTLVMILYGIPTFITGGMVKFKPLIIGGVACWIISAISIYTPVKTDMLLMALCGLVAWLIPGIILWNRYQKRKAEHGV